MSYSIFRVQGVKTLSDLRGIGKHNKERVSHTNPDIDQERSSENIDLISCSTSYRQRFNEITVDMKKEHEERMAKIRSDRRKTFEQAVDTAKNDVAAEFLFTSDEAFFEGKTRAEIEAWAERSLEFLLKDIGILKENIIQATVHMDEKTPHLHVVAVPLMKAWDGRKKADIWQISRKKLIKTKEDLAHLQDVYNDRMNEAGFDLERGESGTDRLHVPTEVLKKESQYYRQELKTVKAEYEVQLQKLEKLCELNEKPFSAEESIRDSLRPPMPSVEIKKTMIGGMKIEVDQVLALQDWGKKMIQLSQQDSLKMDNQEKEKGKLLEVVKLQEKEIDLRASKRMTRKEAEWAGKMQQSKVHTHSLEKKLQHVTNENKALKREMKLKDNLIKMALSFMEKLGVLERFQNMVKVKEQRLSKNQDLYR